VNIGNPTEFTILECARQVMATTGSASEIQFEALPQDDPKQRCPDISKAKRLLGWEPKVELASGLKLSLEYFGGSGRERTSRVGRFRGGALGPWKTCATGDGDCTTGIQRIGWSSDELAESTATRRITSSRSPESRSTKRTPCQNRGGCSTLDRSS